MAIVRVEQLYPFNADLFLETLSPYPDAELVWVQEETRNRGAWSYMLQVLLDLLPDRRLRYVGRDPSASPATGSPGVHLQQQERLVREALAG